MTQDNPSIVLPNGDAIETNDSLVTERNIDRTREDREYVPVIVKRSDYIRRHPDDALDAAIEEGLEQHRRPSVSLGLSAVAAGLIVSFSAMAAAIMTQAVEPLASPVLTRIATALVYPLGFVLCVTSGAQLYTEHTATAVYPVLDRQTSLFRLLRLWIVVVTGNLAGTMFAAQLLALAEPVVQAADGYTTIGRHLVEFSSPALFVSSILAGWLMALGAWMVVCTGVGISQMAGIYLVTFLIGLGGFHHSIAGSAEVFTALLVSEEFSQFQAARFILIALIGNLVGGSVFVGVLNYAHIRRTQPADDPPATTPAR